MKALKLDKSIDKLSDRWEVIEEECQESGREETDAEIEARFVKLREARAKKTDAFGSKTYEDVWDNISEEDEEYYRQKSLRKFLLHDTSEIKQDGGLIHLLGIYARCTRM